jgi:hypothetical protein
MKTVSGLRILRLHFAPLTPCPRSGGAPGGMLHRLAILVLGIQRFLQQVLEQAKKFRANSKVLRCE